MNITREVLARASFALTPLDGLSTVLGHPPGVRARLGRPPQLSGLSCDEENRDAAPANARCRPPEWHRAGAPTKFHLTSAKS